MRVHDEDTWEAEYWDDFLSDFGPGTYIEERRRDMEHRYSDAIDRKTLAAYEQSWRDLGPEFVLGTEIGARAFKAIQRESRLRGRLVIRGCRQPDKMFWE